jgi:hypothetical protein
MLIEAFMRHENWIFLVCLGASTSAIATANKTLAEFEPESPLLSQQFLKQKISQAITKFEQTPREHWHYRISRYENEEGDITSSIEQYDPSPASGTQWTLLSYKGNKPTAKQARKFVEGKLEKDKDKSGHNYSVKLREIIQLDSLQFEYQDQNILQASFAVNLSKLGNKATEKLRGVLTFNKQHEFIDTIEITNSGPFSPVFSANITDLQLTFTFYKIDDAILPHQQKLSMQGSFAFFKEIHEESVDTFSHYQYTKGHPLR